MVILSLEPWEKRQAELELLAELLNRERSYLAGAKAFTQAEVETMAEELLHEPHGPENQRADGPAGDLSDRL